MNVYVYVGVLAYILHECLCVCGCVGLYSTYVCVCGCVAYILHICLCMWVCWPIFYMNVYVYVGVLAYILHECLCVCGCVGLYST